MGLEATWAKFVGKMARIHRDLRFSRGSQSYAYQRIISDMRSTEELWNVLEDKAKRRALYEHLLQVKAALPVAEVASGKYVRLGSQEGDGGYIFWQGEAPPEEERIAYSFGVNDDVSWDLDMAQMGYEVYLYDHTIERLVQDHPQFHFFKVGVCGTEPQPDCRPLAQLVAENGHQDKKDLILKMDVEGAEYATFAAGPSSVLEQFSQIALELHSLTDYRRSEAIVGCLQKLLKSHQPIHIHANNCNSLVGRVAGVEMPEVLEVTYLRRGEAEFKPSRRFFTTELDKPCDPHLPDIELGYWN